MQIEELIGRNVKKAREDAHLTQTEFGELVGEFLGKNAWVPQAVSQAEKGGRDWAAEDLAAVANVLHRSIVWFYSRPADSDPEEMLDLPGGVKQTLEWASGGMTADRTPEQLTAELQQTTQELQRVLSKSLAVSVPMTVDLDVEVTRKEEQL